MKKKKKYDRVAGEKKFRETLRKRGWIATEDEKKNKNIYERKQAGKERKERYTIKPDDSIQETIEKQRLRVFSKRDNKLKKQRQSKAKYKKKEKVLKRRSEFKLIKGGKSGKVLRSLGPMGLGVIGVGKIIDYLKKKDRKKRNGQKS